jgi:DnaJ-class molecular chaperone
MKYILMFAVMLAGCSASKIEDTWQEEDCSECSGIGQVVYDEDHFFVVNGIEDAGTYQCPMCNGSGKLMVQK